MGVESGGDAGGRGVTASPGYRRWGYLAAGWSLLFAAVHVFWASGGQTGLASSAGAALAASRPTWFVAVGLWGTAALLVLVAAVGVAVAGTAVAGAGVPVGPRRWVRLAAGLIATVLVLRSVGVELLLLDGAGEVARSVGPGERDASLWVWNPWFMLGGVLFTLTALTRRSRAGPP